MHTEQSRRAGQAAGRGQALVSPGRPAAQARRSVIVLEAVLGRWPVVVSSVCRRQDQGPTLLYCLHWAYSTYKPRDQGEEVCHRGCGVWRLHSQLMEGQDFHAACDPINQSGDPLLFSLLHPQPGLSSESPDVTPSFPACTPTGCCKPLSLGKGGNRAAAAFRSGGDALCWPPAWGLGFGRHSLLGAFPRPPSRTPAGFCCFL